MTLYQVVQAVKAVDALKRKPEEYKYQSFFSELDLWQFIAITDDRTCAACMNYDTRFYKGNELRTEFEFLLIIDEDTILAQVHPNCRCELHRITYSEHYLSITEKEQKP